MDDFVDALCYVLKGAHMGCDIHWYSETKRNGQWECDQAHTFKLLDLVCNYPEMDSFPGRDRDYWFFGLLQPGVRSRWDWSFPEREAIPDNLSKEIKTIWDLWSTDGHSHGYVTREEIKAKLEELKLLRVQHLVRPTDKSEVVGHHVTRLENCLTHLTSDVPDSDQRIVFWFDN
jgi:hypothetical protein